MSKAPAHLSNEEGRNATDNVNILAETLLASIAADCFTFGCAFELIGIGWWLGSLAMQWFAFIAVIAVVINHRISPRRTPQEAADYLKSKYGVTAK